MAIKPTDAIINIEKLITTVEIDRSAGWGTFAEVLPSFWKKFLDTEVEPRYKEFLLTNKFSPNIYEKLIAERLARFNATYKNSKTAGRYIKFKKHSDLTFFLLRWS